MLSMLLLAWCLMAACVAIHAIGVTSAVRWLRRRPISSPRFWPWTRLFILLAGWIILLHLLEITVWGVFTYGEGRCPIYPPACTSVR